MMSRQNISDHEPTRGRIDNLAGFITILIDANKAQEERVHVQLAIGSHAAKGDAFEPSIKPNWAGSQSSPNISMNCSMGVHGKDGEW